MMNTEYWLAKLANLRVDRARGDPAPHKPLLLLVVLELAEQGLLPSDL
jgi:putative restriction endonuclease